MKYLFFLTTLLLNQACDKPVQTRTAGSATTGQTSSSNVCINGYVRATDGNIICSDSLTDGSSDNDDDDGTTTGDNDDDSVTSEPGFETCNLNFQYYKSTIGYFALCQNTQNEASFKLKMERTDTSVGTCFVPISVQSNGSSYKIGIAECVHNQADNVYNMTLTKERAEAINGVMVLKATALNSYMQCMSAKTDYLNAYPGCAYNTNCLNAANQYATDVCNNFVAVYGTQYHQVTL
jgi:hypothetical protein